MTESLEVMGLADRRVVMVAHRGTAQPHVHVVVNRVSVEDGRAAKLGNSYLKLSRWAEGYEREQVREIDGEQAYEKMRRAVEKASQEKARQEKARQVERARLEWDRQETARQSRERRGPERSGPERDFGPSR